MRLTTLSDNTLLLEAHLKTSRAILKESCDGLTLQQRVVVEGIYNDLLPLVEATLTADQVKNIFKGVEQAAVSGGDNRTLAGLGVDAAKKANDTINQIGKWLQDTAPVKSFDQKFENLKTKVGQKFPELDKKLTSMGAWAKANPGKTAAIIGVMTALAALAAGPAGGAIAGQIIRGASELMQGSKLSTAIGKGIKTAAFGYLTGALLDKVGDMLRGFTARFVPVNDNLVTGTFSYTSKSPGLTYSQTASGHFFKQDADQLSDLYDIFNTATDATDKAEAWWQYVTLVDKVNSDEYVKAIIKAGADAQKAALDNSALYQAVHGVTKMVSAAGQGAAAAASTTADQKESYYLQTRPLSEGQVYMLFNRVATEQLNEGPMDWIKKGAAAVGKGVQRVGQNITNKITYEKLLAGWKLDGSPTDSEALKQFLTSMEVSDDIINKVYADLKIATSATTQEPAGYKDIKKTVLSLNSKDKKRLMTYLTKQLGTA